MSLPLPVFISLVWLLASPLHAYLYSDPPTDYNQIQQQYENELSNTSRMELDENLDQRLEQEIDVLSPSIPSLTNVTHFKHASAYGQTQNVSNLLEEYVEMVRNEMYTDNRTQVTGLNQLSPSKSNRIKAAVFTSYKLSQNPISQAEEYPEYDKQSQMQDKALDSLPIIEVIPNDSRPLEIHFKSATKPIRIVQHMLPSNPESNRTEVTESEEEPHRVYHTVKRPIISHLHQIFFPIVRRIQEIRPVEETVHTIVHTPKKSKVQEKNKFNSKQLGPIESSSEHAALVASSREDTTERNYKQDNKFNMGVNKMYRTSRNLYQ